MNETDGQFDKFRRTCLNLIVVVGLVTPSLVIFLLEITVGSIAPVESLRDIAHRQFAEGHNLFLLAIIGLIPFGILSVILRALTSTLTRARFCFFCVCGLVGILALMVPAHVSVWLPLYTDGPVSSTSAIAFIFIPFYCTISLGVGIAVASLISIPHWIRQAKKSNP